MPHCRPLRATAPVAHFQSPGEMPGRQKESTAKTTRERLSVRASFLGLCTAARLSPALSEIELFISPIP